MLIRVLEIPKPTGKFHFGGGEPQTFIEVDWFRDDPNPLAPSAWPMMRSEEGRAQIIDHIKSKNYFDPTKAYLVLHPTNPMVINYQAD